MREFTPNAIGRFFLSCWLAFFYQLHGGDGEIAKSFLESIPLIPKQLNKLHQPMVLFLTLKNDFFVFCGAFVPKGSLEA